MSAYNPPTFNSPIFDSNAFTTGEQTIDTAYLQANYLKFPTAQGTEHLASGSTATTATTGNNSTLIATTAFVQTAVSPAVNVKPTTWIVSSDNITSGNVATNYTRNMNVVGYTGAFNATQLIIGRCEFQYSIYVATAYSAVSPITTTSGTINTTSANLSGHSMNNPNGTTYFDLCFGYDGTTTYPVWFLKNIQTSSNYWNTQQTYYPANAGGSSYAFTPLRFYWSSSSTQSKILWYIEFPQNPTISGGNLLGNMMSCVASLKIISSPSSTTNTTAYYTSNNSYNTTQSGAWYFD